ncbi:MAG TPA: Xaa-Pro peptidase family protein [Candidatus Kapabacteria bacterium]|nr:Xaa-Pro peptidase family protein [Candidatus Kapabacteria bacterium]
MTQQQLERIQETLRTLGLGAWLLYNFRDSNPIASRMLGIPAGGHQTRRWAYLIPADGTPRGIGHRIEPHISALMQGDVRQYSSHAEFRDGLQWLAEGHDAVAMEYSPCNAVPVVSRVDAGTIELVRSLGVDVVTSADLIAHLEARLTDEQIASACRAGAAVREIVTDAFRTIRDCVAGGRRCTEFDVQQFMLGEFARRGLVTDHAPNCSVGPNSANPHYEPTESGAAEIHAGDFVLIDLWAREDAEGSIFGDITWVGFVGEDVPSRCAEVFAVVRDARDAAFERVRDAFSRGEKVTGAELDDAARDVIIRAGYGSCFTHRTGHSITTELHGAGANLDNFETMDTRTILPATSFSIEPGIYLPGEFGIRSELDVVIDAGGSVMATSEPLQQEVVAIMALQ